MKKIASTLLLISAVSLSINTYAADYTVQVGAYKSSADKMLQKAKKHGEVFQHRSNDNLTKVSVGRFQSRSEANAMRNRLQKSGFSGAFITTLKDEKNYSEAQSKSFAQALNNEEKSLKQRVSSKQRSSSINFNDLSSSEKAKASYLDGKLRILSEGEFYFKQAFHYFELSRFVQDNQPRLLFGFGW